MFLLFYSILLTPKPLHHIDILVVEKGSLSTEFGRISGLNDDEWIGRYTHIQSHFYSGEFSTIGRNNTEYLLCCLVAAINLL